MNPKKRVLLIINSDLINAGVPNVVMTLVRELSDKFTFDAVTYHSKEGAYDTEFESYGGKIYRFSLINYQKHKILYPFRYFQIKRRLKAIFKYQKYDCIHCHNGVESGIFLKFAKRSGVPVRISHAHGMYYRNGTNKILRSYNLRCKKLITKNKTLALACSKQAGESLFLDKDFLNVLNPVDVSYYKDIKREEHEGCNLLQIGYFCGNKNQQFSIGLLRSLIDENIDANLTFIGFPQDEAYYEGMLKMTSELSLKDRISFLPPDADKSKVFPKTDVVLMPSKTEGLPLVALESQAAGVRVLLSDNISKDADIGLASYAQYGNFTEWTEEVKRLYSHRDTIVKNSINTDLIDKSRWCDRIGTFYYGN